MVFAHISLGNDEVCWSRLAMVISYDQERKGIGMPPARMHITLQVNGVSHALAIEPRRTLLDALRHDLALTGTKKVCDMGNCGACTVLLNDQAIYACLRLAVDCAGESITTIEGLGQDGTLDPLQQAFIDADAFQCGYCTAGQIMSLRGLLHETPTPSEAQLVRAVTGNLCRCGAYPNILQAGRLAAARGAETQETSHADATHSDPTR